MPADPRSFLSRRHAVGAVGAGAAGLALPAQAAGAGAAGRDSTARGSRAVAGLQVNSVTEPLGIESAPVFSWVPQVGRQSAYEIEAGTAPGRADMWRSGRVSGPQSTAVPYEGGELASGRPYFWRVRAWDERGRATGWSEPARWETGLLDGERGWAGARWIGGREPQDHDWRDLTETIVFRGGDDPAAGLALLFRAEPVGKTWGEALSWVLRQQNGRIRLQMTTLHYAGNTWVDDGTSEPDWGVDHYDPQSETNPTATGVRSVPVATVDVPESTGLTPGSWADRDHTVVLTAHGTTVTTSVNGVRVDSRTLHGDQIRRHGSIGFGSGSSAVVRTVRVEGTGAPRFDVDLTTGANPFESGVGTSAGLTFVAKNAMLPIANPAPLLRTAQPLPHGEVARARLYLSAAGNVVFTVNGEPLTTDGRQPAADLSNVPRLLTDHSTYDRTVLYDTFDVTRLVRPGVENVLAAELGRGWYGVTTPQEWYWHMAPYAGAPRMRAALVVTYANGATTTVVTDGSWKTADGPTTFDSVYSGEKYDARLAAGLGDWRRGSGLRTGGRWAPATVLVEPGSCQDPAPEHHGPLPAATVPDGFSPARIRVHEAEPVVVGQTLRPVSMRRSAPGSDAWILDFGQIVTGFPVLSLTGVPRASAGVTLRMSGANQVSGDGTPDARSRRSRRTTSTTPTCRRTTTRSARRHTRPGSRSSATGGFATWRYATSTRPWAARSTRAATPGCSTCTSPAPASPAPAPSPRTTPCSTASSATWSGPSRTTSSRNPPTRPRGRRTAGPATPWPAPSRSHSPGTSTPPSPSTCAASPTARSPPASSP